MMIERLRQMAEDLRKQLRSIEPDRLTTGQAAALLEAASELETLAGSVKLLVASRAARSRTWVDEGFRSPAGWIAAKSKASFGEAAGVLDTSRRLAGLSETTTAVRSGRLSPEQAKEVSQAASVDPRAQGDLLKVAGTGNMRDLKEEVRRVKARSTSAKGELERERAIHRGRYLRHWNDGEGAFRLDARFSPEWGARFLSSLRSEWASRQPECPSDGERPKSKPEHVALLDTLVGVVCGTGGRDTPRRKAANRRTDTVLVRVDAAALRRGFAKRGEICEIPGCGPVPVATARRVLGEGFIKLLVRDGVDVKTVCHVGRGIPAQVQTALEERDPRCVVPGCGSDRELEAHHWVQDFAKLPATTLDGLARVCKTHHDQISYDGFKLTGGPGHWGLVAPTRRRRPPTRSP